MASKFFRKVRKAILHPQLYLEDAYKNKLKREGIIWESNSKVGSVKSEIKYSIISAVYNVEKYIEVFVESCEHQTLLPHEIILVDDGSTDNTADAIKPLLLKYKNIVYIRKSNGGQSSARNRGIEIASGEYLTFIDPDDFIDSHYIQEVDKCIKENRSDLVNCNIIIYREARKRYTNNHFLKDAFSREDAKNFDSNHIPPQIVLNNVARSFFKKEIIDKHQLRFDESLREFEDGKFAIDFIRSQKVIISHCKAARYYNRRRADESSTMQNSWKGKHAFDVVFDNGYSYLVERYLKVNPEDKFIQLSLFAQLVWHIKHFINAPKPSFLTHQEFEEYKEKFFKYFDYIDSDVIYDYVYCGIGYKEQVGILGYFQNKLHICNCLYFDTLDGDLAKFHFYVNPHADADIKITSNRKVISPLYVKTTETKIWGDDFYHEVSFWVNLKGLSEVSFEISNRKTKIRIKNKWHKGAIDVNAFNEGGQKRFSFPFNSSFKCWMVCDRFEVADDNGEHFYRYLLKEHKEQNAYFLLNRNSPDWDRLEQEGFKLLAFGSLKAKIFSKYCDVFISSQCDSRQISFFKKSCKFVFLQHGVIKDDISAWLNKYKIDLFVTSTKQEFSYIAGKGPFKFSPKEVVLTGLPRFDSLVELNRKSSLTKRTIVVMPTWRRGLVTGITNNSDAGRQVNEAFIDSKFYRNWQNFLSLDYLKGLNDKGCRIVFWPHINMIDSLNVFKLPDYIEVRTAKDSSIQETFVDSDLFITDYSSTAFDVAYIKKAIIYYQFDQDEIFSGMHTYQKGYFSYNSDGFGPVATDQDELIELVKNIVDKGFVPGDLFMKRIDGTFDYSCESNSSKIFTEIQRRIYKRS